jgi:hypothetical protein
LFKIHYFYLWICFCFFLLNIFRLYDSSKNLSYMNRKTFLLLIWFRFTLFRIIILLFIFISWIFIDIIIMHKTWPYLEQIFYTFFWKNFIIYSVIFWLLQNFFFFHKCFDQIYKFIILNIFLWFILLVIFLTFILLWKKMKQAYYMTFI